MITSDKQYAAAKLTELNGPVCITFEWKNGDAWRVELENYH